MRIYSSNENMIAIATFWVLVRGAMTAIELFPVAIGPDGISYLLLEGESGKGYKAGFSFSNEAFNPDCGDPDFFLDHQIAIIGIPEPRLRRHDIIDSFRREISRAMASFEKEYTFSYAPIEDLPKPFSSFDIRGGGGQAGDLRCQLKNFPCQQKVWYSNDNFLNGINEASEHVFPWAELAGRKLFFGRRQEAVYSEILSLTWPAAI